MPHKARVSRAGFWATLRLCLFLNYWLREFPLSVFANRFELRCEPKQLMLLYYIVFYMKVHKSQFEQTIIHVVAVVIIVVVVATVAITVTT